MCSSSAMSTSPMLYVCEVPRLSQADPGSYAWITSCQSHSACIVKIFFKHHNTTRQTKPHHACAQAVGDTGSEPNPHPDHRGSLLQHRWHRDGHRRPALFQDFPQLFWCQEVHVCFSGYPSWVSFFQVFQNSMGHVQNISTVGCLLPRNIRFLSKLLFASDCACLLSDEENEPLHLRVEQTIQMAGFNFLDVYFGEGAPKRPLCPRWRLPASVATGVFFRTHKPTHENCVAA